MAKASQRYSIVAALEAALGRLAAFAAHRPLSTLSFSLLLTAAAIIPARRLALSADLMGLLPENFESVTALRQVKDRFGGFGYVAVVARGGTPENLIAFADDLAPRLQALPTIRYVDYKRPQEFFEKRFLFFMSLEDLNHLEQRIAARSNWEKRQKNPLYVSLDAEPAPEVEFDDLVDKYAGGGTGRVARVKEAYYLDREAGTIALFAKPSGIGSDLAFSRQVVNDVKAKVASLDRVKYGGNLQISYGGTFTKRVDQQDLITKDLSITTLVAIAAILLYLILYFRRFGAAILLFLPLICGLIWTYGAAGLVFGRLNILTGFIGAILMGLGIDHGIHLLGRFETELKTRSFADAISHAFGRTGRAVLLAALTTIVAFLGLAISEFRAFREFGILAALGMTLVVLATVLILPASLSLLARWGWKPRQRGSGLMRGLMERIARRPGTVVIVAVVTFVALAASSFKGKFDYDTRSLAQSHLESFKLDKELDRLLGYSMTPMVALAESPQHEGEILEAFRARKALRGDASAIDLVMAKSDFVPPDQGEKVSRIRAIGRLIEPLEASDFEREEDRKRLVTLKQAVQMQPFTYADIPHEIRRQFEGPEGGSGGSFVLIFSRLDLSDGQKAIKFAQEVRQVPLPENRFISAAGEPLVMADVFSLVAREAPPVMGVALVLVFLSMWLLMGSLRQSLLSMVPAIFALVATFGLLPLFGLSFNTLNVVMIPVLFGMGVDGGVHLATQRPPADRRVAVYAETADAIFAALVTTALGFGALVLADHSGLNSLGLVTLLGLASNALACVFVLPALLLWMKHRAAPKQDKAGAVAKAA